MKLEELVRRADLRAITDASSEWPLEGSQPLQCSTTTSFPRQAVFTTKPAGWIGSVSSDLPAQVALINRYGVIRKSIASRLRVWLESIDVDELTFVGDLDPTDIAVFLTLKATLRAFEFRVRVRYVGIGEQWLSLCEQNLKTNGPLPTMDLGPFEKALLADLFALESDWQRIVGPRGIAILRAGKKLELEGACNSAFYGPALQEKLSTLIFAPTEPPKVVPPKTRSSVWLANEARGWREAKAPTSAWKRLAAFFEAHRDIFDGDAPWWRPKRSDVRMWTGPDANRLLLFVKESTMQAFLPDGRGSDRGTQWKLATMVAPFWPMPFVSEVIKAHAKKLAAPIGWVGDLDPHSLHVFGALRSGDVTKPSITGRRLPMTWLGLDDEWLRRLGKKLDSFEIRMGWGEREYWGVLKRMMPDIAGVVGERSFALLESGSKLALDPFHSIMAGILRERLRTHLPTRAARLRKKR